MNSESVARIIRSEKEEKKKGGGGDGTLKIALQIARHCDRAVIPVIRLLKIITPAGQLRDILSREVAFQGTVQAEG